MVSIKNEMKTALLLSICVLSLFLSTKAWNEDDPLKKLHDEPQGGRGGIPVNDVHDYDIPLPEDIPHLDHSHEADLAACTHNHNHEDGGGGGYGYMPHNAEPIHYHSYREDEHPLPPQIPDLGPIP